MTDFTFRLRLMLPPRAALEINENVVDLSVMCPPSLNVASFDGKTPIREAKDLVFTGRGFSTRKHALEAGQRVRDALTLALATLRVGAYFGERGQAGGFTQVGLAKLEGETGRRILNDSYGLDAFESYPPPSFARVGEPILTLLTTRERFLSVFSNAIRTPELLTDRHRLAYELFSASFFERSENARLLFLVISVEALLDFNPRPPEVVKHVDALIQATKSALDLPLNERMFLLSSLGWLRDESIRQAGIRLAKLRLSGREYMGLTSEKFFVHCYDLRSNLVHGSHPYPSRAEVGRTAATLEVFVSDLLAGPLLEPDV